MRVATLAAVAAILGLAQPAFALDQVKFATNWLADPEAGGFYEALVDGTYARYGLDVTIIPGGPQSNGALMLLFGKIEFFMAGIRSAISSPSRASFPSSRSPRTSRRVSRFSCRIPGWA